MFKPHNRNTCISAFDRYGLSHAQFRVKGQTHSFSIKKTQNFAIFLFMAVIESFILSTQNTYMYELCKTERISGAKYETTQAVLMQRHSGFSQDNTQHFTRRGDL